MKDRGDHAHHHCNTNLVIWPCLGAEGRLDESLGMEGADDTQGSAVASSGKAAVRWVVRIARGDGDTYNGACKRAQRPSKDSSSGYGSTGMVGGMWVCRRGHGGRVIRGAEHHKDTCASLCSVHSLGEVR